MDNSTKRRKMVHLQDELRAFVEKMSDGRLKCKFCGQLFSATTSITRFKWHWSKVEGRGVKTCDRVTTEIQEAAFQSIQEASNKKRKAMLSSRNMNEVIQEIPTTQEQINGGNNLVGDPEMIRMEEGQPGEERASPSAGAAGNPMENIIGGMTQPIDTSFSPDRLIDDANEPRGAAQQQNNEIDNLARDEGRIQKEVQGTGQGVGEGRTTSCTHETRGDVRQVIEMLSQVGLEMAEGGEALSQQEEALSPGGLAWMDSMTTIDLQMGYTSPKELTLDAPETRPRTEPMHQDCEPTTSDFLPLRTEDNVIENPAMGLMQLSERPSSPERLLINQVELQEDSSLNNDVIVNDVEDMIREPGQHVARGSSHERPPVNQDEPRGDSSQPNDPLCLTHGRSYAQLCIPSVNNDVIMNEVENMVRVPGQPVRRDSSREGLPHNGDESKGDAFPTTKLVGGECAKNKKAIWSWLMNDEVSIIGIYGMGGVGKTTLLKHIYNQLLERPGTFHHVHWVTVARDFSIYRLQNFIAKCLHLDLSNEDEELLRAVKLSKELKKNEKWVLIFDDLWNSFELDKVGIPVPVKGCKLIFTTRSLQVCRGMTCKHKIQVRVLPEEEAWILFMEKLTHDVILSSEVEKIAKSVTRECAGLPLGIIAMARSMRGVDDLHEWRNTLEKLKQSKSREMEDEVFGVLKYSYDRLNGFALQQCLLYCALFPEDCEIPREDLIGYLIDEGIIEKMNRRQAEFDEGHTMLNNLENFCLLESCIYGGDQRAVKMHDLIRDMAHQILQTKSLVMVGEELPDVGKWKEDLVRVSFIGGRFQEIPFIHSPRCPSLSTLLLRYNNKLRFIADSFFKELHGLKVLDLSYTAIEKLPNSICDLAGLCALLLISCRNLRNVPSFEKLRALKRLDLSRTLLENVPRGLRCLSNLNYLRMNGCRQNAFPSGILPKLSRLQALIMEEQVSGKYGWSQYAPVTIKGKEVACLRKLETLNCHFEHLYDFAEYLKSWDETQSLSTYQIFVGQLDKDDGGRMIDRFRKNKSVALGKFRINRDGDFQVRWPNDIEELLIGKCGSATSLCDVSSLIKYATKLEIIRIWDCISMESLVSSSWFCSAPLPSPSYNVIFSSLKVLLCFSCRSMKKLFPLVLLPNLVNLEVIKVGWCDKMEEIIATEDEEGVMGEESSSRYSNIKFNLTKLRILELTKLPELKSICSAKLICNSLQVIVASKCWKLKRIPICLPLLDNGQPSHPPSLEEIRVSPKEWWETVVEWEHPNAKNVLLPSVKFL